MQSKKQKFVATSSAEAEYAALSEASKKAMYLTYLIDELGFQSNKPIIGPISLRTKRTTYGQFWRAPFS